MLYLPTFGSVIDANNAIPEKLKTVNWKVLRFINKNLALESRINAAI